MKSKAGAKLSAWLGLKKDGADNRTNEAPAENTKPTEKTNMPKKKPVSPFFVFMEDFRQHYKETHPNNRSSFDVGKAGSEKWKTLSEVEKASYTAKAKSNKAANLAFEAEAGLQQHAKTNAILPQSDSSQSLTPEMPSMERLGVKKRCSSNWTTGKPPAKKTKPLKDPQMPKKPTSAFYAFMEDFRKHYKETVRHPNEKSPNVIFKAGGEKWRSLSEDEKAPYKAKAAETVVEYNKQMQAYYKKLAEGKEDESDKLRSVVQDAVEDENDESGEEQDDEE